MQQRATNRPGVASSHLGVVRAGLSRLERAAMPRDCRGRNLRSCEVESPVEVAWTTA
jgi:hypothetical protein